MTAMEVAYYNPIAEQDYEHHMIKEDPMHLYRRVQVGLI
jgi:hypothetical protein